MQNEDHQAGQRTVALVTGANKGIGYAIAAGLGALGSSVGVGARNEQRGDEAVQKLQAAGVDAFGVALDVTDDASVAAGAELLEQRYGRLDVLANNAGISDGMPQAPTEVTPDQVRTVVETNVIGPMRMINAPAAAAAPRCFAPHRQHVQLSRFPGEAGGWISGPGLGDLLPLQDVPECRHAAVREGTRGYRHLDQLRLPGYAATIPW